VRTTVGDEWLDLTADLLAGLDPRPPDQRVAELLARTFAARGVAYSHRTGGGPPLQRLWPDTEQFDGHRTEIDRWSARHSPSAHPLLRFYIGSGARGPAQVRDVPERFADRRVRAAWHELAAPWGTPAQLALPVQMAPDSHRAFVLGREDPFTPQELARTATLQRLLVQLDRHAAVAPVLTPVVRAACAEVHLTPRELAVLHLLADGRTAASIARHLAVGERTVHKHLERIYRKLGARDRLTAVVRAQRAGLLPPT
jgi:DNA-binding CsgD family transcriptional regulator